MKAKPTPKTVSSVRQLTAKRVLAGRIKRRSSVLPLIRKRVFEDFITNAKNAFPLAVAKKIADQVPVEGYNPFVLCGSEGTGKTHLLETFAGVFTDKVKNVVFQNAAYFCSENSTAVPRPENFWLHCDVLILDDLQELADQSVWQQCLVKYIDACPRLHQHKNCQMIFACAGSVNTTKKLEERLRSRLEGGLVVELIKPDMDVRLRYIQALCKKHEMTIDRGQRLFLAQRGPDFRLLYGLILKIKAFIDVYNKNPSTADMHNIIRTGGIHVSLTYQKIMEKVAHAFTLRTEEILLHKRRPDIIMARQIAMYICRRQLKLSYAEIGRIFGGKDHSTVIYAVNKIKQLVVSNKNMHNMITKLEQTDL